MKESEILNDLLELLPTIWEQHNPHDALHKMLKKVARQEVESIFDIEETKPVRFGQFGELNFPYHSMGAINSLNLFDLDELIIFSFYYLSRNRYKKVLDIGANIGLHSTLLGLCGYEVHSFEPDPVHYELLKRNLELNGCTNNKVTNAAVSSEDGELEFVRVLGNTTGSHLAGAKDNPYGDLERFPVEVKAFGPLIEWADLIKMDVEGHEPEILLSTKREDWENTDALIEIQNEKNAGLVYDHFQSMGVNLFCQQLNWGKAESLADIPTSYKQGTLFASCSDRMPW